VLGITSIVVSHDVAEASLISDYAYLLGDGRILGQGTPTELRQSTSPHVRQFMDGLPDGPVPYTYPARNYLDDLFAGNGQ
jgi:phospholipid/cholesterol/gamma-HCH transport system ATP-binding protein